MKKNDLKNGMVVETKNGNIYLVLKPFGYSEFIFVSNEGSLRSDHYDDNLQHTLLDQYSIARMYNLYENEFSIIMKKRSDIHLQYSQIYFEKNDDIKNNKVLDKLNSIQNQLDEIKNIIS